jgi:peptidyl-prolyl cis-trans isomerase D
MIKVVLGVIVVVFIFWGVGSYRDREGSRIAVVNGDAISLDEYRSTYEQLVEQYRSQFGNAMDQKLLKTLNIKKQAMDQLINRRLILQAADRLKLLVTDKDLVNAIQRIDAFQENGRFAPWRYQRLLTVNRMTPEMFEENLRADLLVDKMRGLILGSIKVSDAEALENFQWQEEKMSIQYVAVKPSSFKDIKITPEEIESYFSTHDKDYEEPPKVKVAYVRFGFKDLESQVSVTEEEINEHFELNSGSYAKPKKVRARHILFKLEQGSSQKELDEARSRAQKVLGEARSGADFAELARKYSDDPGSNSKGGDLGFFSRDRMVKPFSDAAFAMKPGDISELVASRFGWHVIKVEEIQEAEEPVLANVHDKIRDKLVQEGARNLAYDKSEDLYDASYGGAHISDIVKARGIEHLETDFFSRGDPIKDIKQAREFASVAFDLGDDEVSEPVELTDGYYVLQVSARKEAAIPELGSVEKKVRKDLIRVRQDELAKKAAEQFFEMVKEGNAFETEAKNLKLEAKSTDFFKRQDSIPGIGFEREIVDVAFSLKPSSPLPDRIMKGRQGYYVIHYKDRKVADSKEFESKKGDIATGIRSLKREGLMDEWLAQLRQEGEVSIEEGFLV